VSPELPKRTTWRQEGDTVIVEIRSHPGAAAICLVFAAAIAVVVAVAWTRHGLSLGVAGTALMGFLFLVLGVVSTFGHAELRRSPDRIFYGTALGDLRLGRSVATADVRKVEWVDRLEQSTRKPIYSSILIVSNRRPMHLGAGYSKPQVEFLWKIIAPGFRSSTRTELVSSSD
jgi:hypothetical protein